MSKSLIVLGTGESLPRYSDEVSQLIDKYDVLAWGATFDFCIDELNKTPSHFSYIDPKGAVSPFEKILEKSLHTNVILLSPIVTKSLAVFRKYMESTSGKAYRDFTYYLKLIEKVKDVTTVQEVPCTTLKGLHISGSPLRYKDLDNKDAILRFIEPQMICGMKDNLGGIGNQKPGSKYMNLYESKLTMFIFPLCYYLGYKKIYLIGFDGKGGRYFNKKLKDDKLIKTMSAFLPKWLEWEQFHGMKFYSLVESKYTVINAWIPHVQIQTLSQ